MKRTKGDVSRNDVEACAIYLYENVALPAAEVVGNLSKIPPVARTFYGLTQECQLIWLAVAAWHMRGGEQDGPKKLTPSTRSGLAVLPFSECEAKEKP